MNRQKIEQFYHEFGQRLNALAKQENAQENGEWCSQGMSIVELLDAYSMTEAGLRRLFLPVV